MLLELPSLSDILMVATAGLTMTSGLAVASSRFPVKSSVGSFKMSSVIGTSTISLRDSGPNASGTVVVV